MKGLYQDRYLDASTGAPKGNRNIRVRDANNAGLIDISNFTAGDGFDSQANPFTTSNDALDPAKGVGYYSFYADPGNYRVVAPQAPQFDVLANVPVPAVNFRYVDANIAANQATPPTDDTALIQHEIDVLTSYNGKTGQGGVVMLGPRVYNITSIVLPSDVSLVGVDPTVTVLKQVPGCREAAILCVPASVPGDKLAHSIRRLLIVGNKANTDPSTSDTSVGESVISPDLQTAQDYTGPFDAPQGYIVEARGVSPGTVVDFYDPGVDEIGLLPAAVQNITGPTTTVIRRAITIQISNADPTSKIVKFLSTQDTRVQSLKIGMQVFVNAGLTINSGLVVTAIRPFPNGREIEFQKPTGLTAGPGNRPNLLFYVATPGIRIVDPVDYAIPYDSSLEYPAPILEQVQVADCTGHGIHCEARRPGLQMRYTAKSTGNRGCGIRLESATNVTIDSKVGLGQNWLQAIYATSCQNVRIVGCDMWNTGLNDKFPEVQFENCRQVEIISGDINGRIGIKNSPPTTEVVARISGFNWRWRDADGVPYPPSTIPSAPCYISVDGACVALDAPYFEPDPQSNVRPDHLWQLRNSARITSETSNMFTASANVRRPYQIAMQDLDATSQASGWYIDLDAQRMVFIGDYRREQEAPEPVPAGDVAEIIAPTPLASPGMTLSHNVWATLLTMTLSPGDWDEYAVVHINCNGAKIETIRVGTTSGDVAVGDGPDRLTLKEFPNSGALTFTGTITLRVPVYRVRLGASSSEYLKVRIKLHETALGSVTAWASIYARRMR